MAGQYCTHGRAGILNWLYGASGSSPSSWYFAVYAVDGWVASTSYSVGDFVVASTSSPERLYTCTTAGTSGSSEPAWPTTDNDTVTDGTVTWTEATSTLSGGTFPTEVSGNGYSRASLTNNTTNFPNTTTGSTDNATVVQFDAATGDWGNIVLCVLYDAATGGNAWSWGTLAPFRDILDGDQLQFPAANATFTQS